MLAPIERENLPSLPPLPPKIREGLIDLWQKSINTGTEWVAGVTKDGLIPLGHQSEGMTTIPVIDILQRSLAEGVPFTEKFIADEIILGGTDIRQTPNEDGICYQGKVLFLLPSEKISDHVVQLAESENSVVLNSKDFMGLAHTHPFRNCLSHLPSLWDVRDFIFQSFQTKTEFVTSALRFSLLTESPRTPNHRLDPDRSKYRLNQEIIDLLKFEGYSKKLPADSAFREVLRDNCFKYHLGLYEGSLTDTISPLLPVFRN